MSGGIGILVAAVPLVLLLVLANAAEKRRLAGAPDGVLSWLTWGFLVLLWLAILGGGLAVAATGLVAAPFLASAAAQIGPAGALISGDVLVRIGVVTAVTALAGLLALLPPVRSLAACVTPLDSRSLIDGTALSLVFLGILNIAITLAVGLDSLATTLEAQGDLAAIDLGSALGALLAQGILLVAISIAGVGFPIRRNWSETLERLAISWPRGRDWLVGMIGWGALLLAAGLIAGVAQLVGLGPDASVERLTEALLGPLTTSLVGIVAIGLVSGISEEALFRGAMQPRFGLVATAIVFTLLHANYGLSLSTLVVLALGLILGVVRQRSSTTAAMLAHGLYNTTLLLGAYLATQVLTDLPLR